MSFEVRESNSALRNFARVWYREGIRCAKFFRRCERKYDESSTE